MFYVLQSIGIEDEVHIFFDNYIKQHYYFNAVDLDNANWENRNKTPVQAETVDEVVTSYYGWTWNEMHHKAVFVPFGLISAISLAVGALAM